MTEQSSKKSMVVVVFAALALSACANGVTTGEVSGTGGTSSTGSGGTTGSGGSGSGGQGTGGVTETGGTTGTGGDLGKGGATGSGGATSTGGVTGTGGANGSGGATSTGGITGTGGLTGTGGVAGAGGTAGAGGLAGRGGMTGSGGVAGSGGRGGASGSGGGSTGKGGASGGSTGSGGSVTCTVGQVPSGATSHCSSNQSGTVGSQQWTIWSSGSGGCLITYGSAAAFSATWNNSGDFLARVGLSLGSNKTYDQFGTLGVDFAESKSGNGGGYSSIGVYGWSVSPLVEFYVVEDSYNGLNGSGTKKGTFTIDGEGTYNVYQHQQNNQPSIQGTATFQQYISVRTSARTCGHISLTKHFDAWKSFGMTLGKMEEAKVLVEAGGGSGRIDFPTANVTAQ
jgi:endo-1,4-beta-xylanase